MLSVLSPRWRKVFRDLWDNKSRTILVVLSISVGVFAFGSVFITRVVIEEDLDTAYRATNPTSFNLTISNADEDIIRAIEGLREIEKAEGRRQYSVSAVRENVSSTNIDIYAFPDFNEQTISSVQLAAGRWPERREIAIEDGSLGLLGVEIGDTVTIETPSGEERDLVVSGYVNDLEVFPAVIFPLANGYISAETLEWLGEERTFDLVNIIVAENRTNRQHIEAIAELTSEFVQRQGYAVTNVDVRDPLVHWSGDFTNTLTTLLAGIGSFALALSGFLVINTITAILSQQQRQIGMMKSVGALRGQVISIYMAMVLIFGLLALFVAVPVGVALAFGLTSVITTFLGIQIINFYMPLWVLGLMIMAALIVPVLAALVPIFRGTAITVREAISDFGIGQQRKDNWLDKTVESILSNIRMLPRPVILSLRNTFRRQGRLTLTLIVLTLAGAIFISVLSVRGSMILEFQKIIQLFNYDIQMVLNDSYPIGRLEREALRIDGVIGAESWTAAGATRIREDGTESNSILMLAPPPETPYIIPTVVEGRWLQPGDQNAVVFTRDVTSEEPDISAGDTVKLEIDGTTREWEVVGIIDTSGQLFAYANFDYLSKIQGTSGQGSFLVIGTAERTSEFQQEVLDVLDDRFERAGIQVGQAITNQQIQGAISGQINFVISFMLFMSGLLAVVGGLGLAGTMSLNVLERTREIGVLRAVGASNWAVSQIVLIEGLIIGFISIVFAALLAIPMSYIFGVLVGNAFFERPLVFNYELSSVLGWLIIASIIASIASLTPARRASRVSVRESLAYE